MAYLDGSNRTTLVNTSIGSPNGLTLDYEKEVLYWCDARKDRIESINLNNMTRRVLTTQVMHPFAITLYSNFLFWTDWGQRAIKRMDIKTNEIKVMRSRLSSLMGIQVYDQSRQQGMLSYFHFMANVLRGLTH